MAPPILEWTDELDVPRAGLETDFGEVAPGAPPTLVTRRLHNNRLGSPSIDTARDLRIFLEAQEGGGAIETEGLDLLDSRAYRVRLITENGVTVSRGFVPLGTGVQLPLADLDEGNFHEFEIQPLPPATGKIQTTHFFLRAVSSITANVGDAGVVPRGHFKFVGRGAAGATGVLARSGPITVTGISTLNRPDYSWYYEGLPLSELLEALPVSDVDGDAATLVATESYLFYDLLTAAGRTILKGSKAFGRVFPDDAPPIGAGDVALGFGERFADIDVVDMTFTELSGAELDFMAVRVTGLNATVGNTAGPVYVEGARRDTTTENVVPLTDDAENTLWVLVDGTLATSLDGTPPQPGALEFWRLTMAAGVLTLSEDLRLWADVATSINLTLDNPQGTGLTADSTGIPNLSNRSWRIRPDSLAVAMSESTNDMNPAPSAGTIAFDVLVKVAGVETTIFTSQGSDDRRPQALFGTDLVVLPGLPETPLEVPPGGILIFRVDNTLATPANSPDFAVLSLVMDIG